MTATEASRLNDSMCRKIFADAAQRMNCPIRLTPQCHPRAPLDVYINARRKQAIVCCSKCDRPIVTINARLKRKGKCAPVDKRAAK